MNFKQLNGDGPVKVSMIADWIFRILSLTLLVAIPLILNLEHRVTVIEGNRYTAAEGQIAEKDLVVLEERYRSLKQRVERLQRELDRLEGHQ